MILKLIILFIINNIMLCPICKLNVKDIKTTLCNHSFCENCLNEWLQFSDKCPVCRMFIKEEELKLKNKDYEIINIKCTRQKYREIHNYLITRLKYLLNMLVLKNSSKITRFIIAITIFEIINNYHFLLINYNKFYSVFKDKINELLEEIHIGVHGKIDSNIQEKLKKKLLLSKKMCENIK